ncbi:hypothetical protein N0V90_010996 [Kalmusia sp. IMI 367209]|nr:hypothetical protein N0V90_010996 [Kalmusia sp. IMI 367209]
MYPVSLIETTFLIRQSSQWNTTELPFIVSVDRQKADANTRKLIRSHVMRGKNRTRTRRKHAKGLDEKTETGIWMPNGPIWPGTIPREMCSKFAGIRFADTIAAERVEEVFSSMFVLDQCIIPNEAGMVEAWFAPMLVDPAYLHAACLTTQAFFDGFLGRTRSAEARRQDYVSFATTVKILQNRISRDDDTLKLSDSTIMTIWALSGYAYTQGHHEAAHAHNAALIKLISMRGVDTIFHNKNTKLVTEIIRTDFCMAYESGKKSSLFAYEDIPWPLIQPPTTATPSRNIDDVLSRLDPRLAQVWTAMAHFCRLLNNAAENEDAKLTEEAFLGGMGSILYRLLHHRFRNGSIDETFRHGLLALSAPIFLDWKTVNWLNGQFTIDWKQSLIRYLTNTGHAPRDCVWLLMVAAMSVFADPGFTIMLDHRSNMHTRPCDMSVTSTDDFAALLMYRLRLYTELCGISTWNEFVALCLIREITVATWQRLDA